LPGIQKPDKKRIKKNTVLNRPAGEGRGFSISFLVEQCHYCFGFAAGVAGCVGMAVGEGATVESGCTVDVGVGLDERVGVSVGTVVGADGAVGAVCGYAGAAVGTNGTGMVFWPTGVEAVTCEIPAAAPRTTLPITATITTAPMRSFFERSDELRYFHPPWIVVVSPTIAVSSPRALLIFIRLISFSFHHRCFRSTAPLELPADSTFSKLRKGEAL
jgi:hypothetical protein